METGDIGYVQLETGGIGYFQLEFNSIGWDDMEYPIQGGRDMCAICCVKIDVNAGIGRLLQGLQKMILYSLVKVEKSRSCESLCVEEQICTT